jgi:hypothetical protein
MLPQGSKATVSAALLLLSKPGSIDRAIQSYATG